jgi:hypothetical protein
MTARKKGPTKPLKLRYPIAPPDHPIYKQGSFVIFPRSSKVARRARKAEGKRSAK